MGKYVLIVVLFFSRFISFSQNENENWMLFRDANDSELIGYKDSKGNVKIKPKFTFITSALVFKNIIPVFEKTNITDKKDYNTTRYYLLKNGKKVGTDSLYVHDFTLDCESEDKIRFRDHKTDKVGFFDKNGNVKIPAIYNDARRFYNGLALVIKDGKRMCWDNTEFSDKNQCEHWSWEGNVQLINDRNELISEHIDLEKNQNIDWYSLQINPKQINESNIVFDGKDGNRYVFSNAKKEFETWLYTNFLKKTDQSDFLNNCFDHITVSKNGNLVSKEFGNSKFKEYAWTIDTKEDFYTNNKTFIAKIITIISLKKSDINLSTELSPILFKYEDNPSFFDYCGEYLNEKFPFFKVYITRSNGSIQYALGFIRTNEGYKLIEIS